MVGCCKLLGVGSFFLAAVHTGQVTDVPVNLQQDKGHSLFCNFLSVCECESVRRLKVNALRMAILYISGC